MIVSVYGLSSNSSSLATTSRTIIIVQFPAPNGTILHLKILVEPKELFWSIRVD